MDKYTTIYQELRISRLALGCMRIADLPSSRVAELINAALDVGINFYIKIYHPKSDTTIFYNLRFC